MRLCEKKGHRASIILTPHTQQVIYACTVGYCVHKCTVYS